MNAALHISYDDFVLSAAAARNKIDNTTGAHSFSTGEKVTLAIHLTQLMQSAWNRCRGKDWVWPFAIQSATLTVTAGVIALTDISNGAWISLWSADPRPASSTAYRIPIRCADASGIYPHDSLTSVFALYIARSPEFGNTAWAANTSYNAGVIRYYSTTGQCFRAKTTVPDSGIAITDTTYWEEQLIHRPFEDYLSDGVEALYQRANGQYEKAAALDAAALGALEREFGAAFRTGPSGSGKPWITGGTWL